MIVYKLMIMIMIIWNCNKDTVTAPTTVSVMGVSVGISRVNLVVGESSPVEATVLPATATNNAVTWSSSDETIATVSEGVITGESAGTANIIVTTTDGGHTDTVVVRVTIAAAVTSVSLDQTGGIIVGTKDTVIATVVAVGGAAETVTWTTSDTTVATVDSNGVISGVLVGTAIITATATADTSKKATATITVTATVVAVTGVTLDSSIVEIVEDSTARVVATVSPPTATNPAVTWTTSDTTVATVDGGVITGVSAGTTNIIVTTVDGDFKDTVVVTIVAPILVTGVTLESSGLTIVENATATASATVVPDSAFNRAVSWRSDSIAIATVDNGIITGISAGTANIIVTTADGDFKDTVVVTVIAKGVRSVSLDQTVLNIVIGTKDTLMATIVVAGIIAETVTWTSSDTTVATVDSNGVISGVLIGTAIITVTSTADTSKKATATITVTAKNISTGATITHTITNFILEFSDTASQIAAISDGDKTTRVNNRNYQVSIGSQWGATITHHFSKPYQKGVYTYYGHDHTPEIAAMNGATVSFMYDNIVVETMTIRNPTKDITVTPSRLTVFNKVVAAFPNGSGHIAFSEIEILGVEAIASVGGVYSVGIISPVSYVEVGDSLQLSAWVSSTSGTATTVTWRSNDATIATVNASGKVTGVSVGTMTITAISTADPTQTTELEITVIVLEDISTGIADSMGTGDSISHTITTHRFPVGANPVIYPYSTAAKQIAAISDGDKTTTMYQGIAAGDAYQVGINLPNTTITHHFSKLYRNGVYTYYGGGGSLAIGKIDYSTVTFMNNDTVVEIITIRNPTKNNITVTPSRLTVFNKVVTTFPLSPILFYEIEILAVEATQ